MFFCTKEKAWQKLIASQTLRSNCVSLANKMHDCTTKEEKKKKKPQGVLTTKGPLVADHSVYQVR